MVKALQTRCFPEFRGSRRGPGLGPGSKGPFRQILPGIYRGLTIKGQVPEVGGPTPSLSAGINRDAHLRDQRGGAGAKPGGARRAAVRQLLAQRAGNAAATPAPPASLRSVSSLDSLMALQGIERPDRAQEAGGDQGPQGARRARRPQDRPARRLGRPVDPGPAQSGGRRPDRGNRRLRASMRSWARSTCASRWKWPKPASARPPAPNQVPP